MQRGTDAGGEPIPPAGPRRAPLWEQFQIRPGMLAPWARRARSHWRKRGGAFFNTALPGGHCGLSTPRGRGRGRDDPGPRPSPVPSYAELVGLSCARLIELNRSPLPSPWAEVHRQGAVDRDPPPARARAQGRINPPALPERFSVTCFPQASGPRQLRGHVPRSITGRPATGAANKGANRTF